MIEQGRLSHLSLPIVQSSVRLVANSLATVRRIIERHGGSISGYGEPGAGATFAFHLEAALP